MSQCCYRNDDELSCSFPVLKFEITGWAYSPIQDRKKKYHCHAQSLHQNGGIVNETLLGERKG